MSSETQPTNKMGALEVVAAIEAASTILGFIDRAIAAGRERGEWTPEEEAAFDAKLSALKELPYWKPEGQ